MRNSTPVNHKSKATAFQKQHLKFCKKWDCYQDKPDEERNEIKASIITVNAILGALKMSGNKIHNAKSIVYYKNVLKVLKERLATQLSDF